MERNQLSDSLLAIIGKDAFSDYLFDLQLSLWSAKMHADHSPSFCLGIRLDADTALLIYSPDEGQLSSAANSISAEPLSFLCLELESGCRLTVERKGKAHYVMTFRDRGQSWSRVFTQAKTIVTTFKDITAGNRPDLKLWHDHSCCDCIHDDEPLNSAPMTSIGLWQGPENKTTLCFLSPKKWKTSLQHLNTLYWRERPAVTIPEVFKPLISSLRAEFPDGEIIFSRDCVYLYAKESVIESKGAEVAAIFAMPYRTEEEAVWRYPNRQDIQWPEISMMLLLNDSIHDGSEIRLDGISINDIAEAISSLSNHPNGILTFSLPVHYQASMEIHWMEKNWIVEQRTDLSRNTFRVKDNKKLSEVCCSWIAEQKESKD